MDHLILLSRLERLFGVSGAALDWFRSYLSGRTQAVNILGASSDARKLDFGVPQGSVLGPILFLLYISPIYDILRRHGIDAHLFADDTQCYTGFSLASGGVDQRRAFNQMECCVRELGEWFDANRLRNNFSKLVNMFISSSSPSSLRNL